MREGIPAREQQKYTHMLAGGIYNKYVHLLMNSNYLYIYLQNEHFVRLYSHIGIYRVHFVRI
jgi:hypothetical protein